MATLRLFAQARETAGAGTLDVSGGTVGDVLDLAVDKFGADFGRIVDASKVWLNGSPVERDATVSADDEVAVLPPVSGG